MTMVFRVANPDLLQRVKRGDKVKFEVRDINGTNVVTRIEVAK